MNKGGGFIPTLITPTRMIREEGDKMR